MVGASTTRSGQRPARARASEAQLSLFAVPDAPGPVAVPDAPVPVPVIVPVPVAVPDAPVPVPVSVPVPVAVPEPARVAVPDPARVAVPDPARVAVPDPARVAVPDPLPVTPPVSRTRALTDAIHVHLPHARVLITDNRTILLSQSQRDGVRTVRVHQMFLDAPAPVRAAMAHFLARGDRKSGAVVDGFVEAQSHLLQLAARPLPPEAHRGRVHDLLPMYAELNRSYFKDRIDAEIGWSQPGSPQRRSRRSITFGSYDARAKRIVIHPVLDQPEVPAVAVARVVHHEMLHAHHGAERDAGGRRIVHGPAFRADEAKFHAAREADAWFDRHLHALLRWRPGRRLGLKG